MGRYSAGQAKPAGGEFQLTDHAGRYNIDVGLVIETDDGANIYMRYTGIADMRGTADKIKKQGYLDFGDSYFFTQPVFESGHEKYHWLNGVICIGEDRVASGWVVE